MSPKDALYKAPEALKKAGLQSEKHPVSYLLEVCNRKKWPHPVYNCTNEDPQFPGKAPAGGYIMEVEINGRVHKHPTALPGTKKEAKAAMASFALRALGLQV